eukprot:536506-Pleurochrysis_carterae.AAC.1
MAAFSSKLQAPSIGVRKTPLCGYHDAVHLAYFMPVLAAKSTIVAKPRRNSSAIRELSRSVEMIHRRRTQDT